MESNEKYRVRCIVDNTQPEIKAMQEKDMKKRLLCELEEVLCSGDVVTIKVTREESPDNLRGLQCGRQPRYIYREPGLSTGNANYDKCGAVQKILHTGNAKDDREGDEAGSTTPGTEDNTGLHGSRADNTAGNKYGN